MTTPASNTRNDHALDLERAADTSALKENSNALSRFRAGWRIGSANADGLTEVELEKARARTAIAKAAVSAAEKKATAAIVASAMPTFGALAATLNARTSAVDQQLTTGAAAEAFGHMANRASNVDFANELASAGRINPEERDVLVRFANDDAAEDVSRSRQRMKAAKEAVEQLHAAGLASIERAKDRLGGE